MMSCKGCCRILFSILAALLGIAATIMLIYGAVHSTNVSLSKAQSDKVDDILYTYVSCIDRRDAYPMLNDGTDKDFRDVFLYQCETARASFLVFPLFAAIAMVFAVLMGLVVVNSHSPKSSVVWFHIMGGATVALAISAAAFTSLSTQYTASQLIPCGDHFTNATAARIAQLHAVCITGPYSINGGGDNKTALTWLGDLIVLYTGAGLAIMCVVFLMFANGCSSRESIDNTEGYEPLMNQPMRQQPMHNTRGYNFA